jgi:hypothetical protein
MPSKSAATTKHEEKYFTDCSLDQPSYSPWARHPISSRWRLLIPAMACRQEYRTDPCGTRTNVVKAMLPGRRENSTCIAKLEGERL